MPMELKLISSARTPGDFRDDVVALLEDRAVKMKARAEMTKAKREAAAYDLVAKTLKELANEVANIVIEAPHNRPPTLVAEG